MIRLEAGRRSEDSFGEADLVRALKGDLDLLLQEVEVAAVLALSTELKEKPDASEMEEKELERE